MHLVIISGNHCLNKSAEIHQFTRIIQIIIGWLSLPINISGLFVTILFIASVLRAIRQRRVSRKFYALLLNRAFGDAFATVIFLITFAYVIHVKHVNVNVVQILNTLFVGSAMISYVNMGLMKLYGIARPFQYKKYVTMRRCIWMIVFSWIVFAILTVITMFVTALVKIKPLADWSGCYMENCLKPMYRVRNGVTAIVYFFTLICFLITVYLIRRAKNNSERLRKGQFKGSTNSSNNEPARMNSGNKLDTMRQSKDSQSSKNDPGRSCSQHSNLHRRRFRFPMIKLTLNVSTLTVFHLPYTIWGIFMAFAPSCFFTYHWNTMMSIYGVVQFFLALRILFDSVMGFVLDKELRRCLFTLLHITCFNKRSNGMSAGDRVLTISSRITEFSAYDKNKPVPREISRAKNSENWTPNSSVNSSSQSSSSILGTEDNIQRESQS
ncbi:DihydroCaffeic Acid Receptor [Ditylenchus destructor]|nr:DihydroCaffeic Acid Receptor [Ditylenchus destructor]